MPIDPRVSQGAKVLGWLLAIALSWQWGYKRAEQACWKAHGEVTALMERIARYDALVQTSGNQAAWLERNRQRLAQLNTRFPQQTNLPQVLNTLVETLKTGEMKLLNITQGNLEPAKDGGQPLLIDRAPCYRLPVMITAEGRYLAILAALQRLTNDAFPALVSIDEVDLQLKDKEGGGNKLAAVLQIHVFVTGPPHP